MRISAYSNGKQVKNPCESEPRPLTVPIYDVKEAQGLVFGLRQEMLSMGKTGRVATGSGLGTDYIILEWGEHQAVLRGSEILKAWVETFSPKDAARFPKGVKSLDS